MNQLHHFRPASRGHHFTAFAFAFALRTAVLEFHRLMRPLKDSSKGPRKFFDPGREFGPERVHETGDHISRCIAALGLGDGESALAEAEAAATRWRKEDGEVLMPKIQE